MNLNWSSAIFGIDTITGGLCFLIFFIAYLFPPKGINSTYGYRTSRAMKSQKNWDFAQKYSGKVMLQSTALLTGVGLLGLVVDLAKVWEISIGMLLLFIALLYPIYLTEKALKRLDDEENNSNH